MAVEEQLKNVKEGVSVIVEVIKAAGDNPKVKEAGGELGKTALTLTKAINNILLPVAAVNFAFDKAKMYFANQFPARPSIAETRRFKYISFKSFSS